MTTTKAEQETTIRWDQAERVLHLYTAHPATARRWTKLGYRMESDCNARGDEPSAWRAQAPVEALRLRRLVDGQVASRARGRSFGPEHRKSATSERAILQE